jgi:hypothetical protein
MHGESVGVPREAVVAELQRVGAKILSEEDTFVQAQAFPAVAGSLNNSFGTINMAFYFDEGRLTSRRDWPSIPR